MCVQFGDESVKSSPPDQLTLVRVGSHKFHHTPLEFFRPEWFGQEREVRRMMADETRAAGQQQKPRMISSVPSQPRPELQPVAIRQLEIADHYLERALG